VCFQFPSAERPRQRHDVRATTLLQKYWTNFARAGNPNGPGVPSWPAFDQRSRAYVAFTAEGAVARNGLRRPFCDLFFDHVKP
jgi:para-nitrobenzyl esterase